MPGATTLPITQRTRLLRTTRKLESILGETIIVDLLPLVDPKDIARCAPSSKRPVLSVRVPSASSVAVPNSPASPASASCLTPLSSTTPTSETFAGVNNTRRRVKLAKVSRTLGENIPVELVFGPSLPRRTTRARRASSLSLVHPGPALSSAARPRGMSLVAGSSPTSSSFDTGRAEISGLPTADSEPLIPRL